MTARNRHRNRNGAAVFKWLIEPLAPDVRKSVERLARADDVHHVAVMPDVHLAESVCVGVVVGTSRLIYPQAVGGDIGCGMAAVAFDSAADALVDQSLRGRLLARLTEAVPAMRHRQLESSPVLPPELLDPGTGRPALSAPPLVRDAMREGRVELGTLGRGNHFLEFQSDDEGRLWLMLHSGSRHMGQAITAFYLARATKSGAGLAALDADGGEGRAYLADVGWACAYADASRRHMLSAAARLVFEETNTPVLPDTLLICNHNHVRREMHDGTALWVHRKGAISAAAGEPGIVPGSMGTRSYHVIGRGDSTSLRSSSHGAGRVLSRDAARRKIAPRELRAEMQGVAFDERLAARLCEEAPSAYKRIERVMRAQKDLTRIIRRLRPLLVYKGI